MMVSSNLQCIAKGTLTQDCTLPDHPSSQNLEGIRRFACAPIASREQPLYTFREALQLLACLFVSAAKLWAILSVTYL